MNEDPYRPPQELPVTDAWNDSSPQLPGEAPALTVEHLRRTRPWVKFCSLAGYITSGFILLIAAITIRKMLGNFPLLTIILLGSFYLVLAVLFVIPSLRLSRYERSITHLEVSQRIEDLEQALADQCTFWKQMGIMILILMIIYLITIAISALALLSGKL